MVVVFNLEVRHWGRGEGRGLVVKIFNNWSSTGAEPSQWIPVVPVGHH